MPTGHGIAYCRPAEVLAVGTCGITVMARQCAAIKCEATSWLKVALDKASSSLTPTKNNRVGSEFLHPDGEQEAERVSKRE